MSSEKHQGALRTIGEVADSVGVATHVLRFWESKFTQINPQKRRGRRYYRAEDITVIKTIKELLYDQGYTIKGVHKFLKAAKKQGIETALSTPYNDVDSFDNVIISNDDSNQLPGFGALEIAKLKQIYRGLCASRNKLSDLDESNNVIPAQTRITKS